MEEKPEGARVERGPITEVPHFALGMAALLERQGFTVAADEMRRLHAQRDALLAVLKELQESASYWSEYDVPLGIVDRINAAIAKAED